MRACRVTRLPAWSPQEKAATCHNELFLSQSLALAGFLYRSCHDIDRNSLQPAFAFPSSTAFALPKASRVRGLPFRQQLSNPFVELLIRHVRNFEWPASGPLNSIAWTALRLSGQ